MKPFVTTLIAAVLALLLTGFVAALLEVPFFQSLEAWMGDRMMTGRYDLLNRPGSVHQPDSRLLMVKIDQESVNDLGRWPFPRAVHCQLLQVLAPENPQVVAWDVFFTEKTLASPIATSPDATSTPTGTGPDATPALQPDDQALVQGARLIPRMVTTAAGDFENGSNLKDEDTLPTHPLRNIVGNMESIINFPFAILPFPELRKVSYFGFAEASAQDLRRDLPLVVRIRDKVFPSFDLQILMQYYGVDPDHVVIDLGREITLTAPNKTVIRIPIDEAGEFLVDYRAKASDFQSVSYSILGKGLADKINNRSSSQRDELPPLKDKIVLIGVTLSGTDNGPIPIEAYAPGVVAHLNLLNDILRGDYLKKLNGEVWLPFYALFLFAVGSLMFRVGFAPMIPIALTAMFLLADASFATLWFGNQMMPIVIPELGVLLLSTAVPAQRFLSEEREKNRIKDVLRANLSDKVMNKMLLERDNVKLGGIKQEITILFCDIRNFTSYCDARDPQEVMDVLNEYMEEMTQVVFRHEGTVDKYIGDCIMAFWNAPQKQADHAERAVACAVEMQETLTHFVTKGASLGVSFECGIGIHTGEALVGNMGSSLKRNYTAMGSTVNMASRLESLTRQLHECILISKEVVDQLHADFSLVDRGYVRVSGIAKPIRVYAVVSEEEKTAASQNDDHSPVSTPPPIPMVISKRDEELAKIVRQPLWRKVPLPEEVEQESNGIPE